MYFSLTLLLDRSIVFRNSLNGLIIFGSFTKVKLVFCEVLDLESPLLVSLIVFNMLALNKVI